jgi:hypothetical protein
MPWREVPGHGARYPAGPPAESAAKLIALIEERLASGAPVAAAV